MADFYARYPVTGGGSGTVTEVTATSPISVTDPDTTPNISMTPASATDEGYITTGAQELAGAKTFKANTYFEGTIDTPDASVLEIGQDNATGVIIGNTSLADSSYVSVNPSYIEFDVHNVSPDNASGHYLGTSEQSMYIYDDAGPTSSSVTIYAGGSIEIEGTGTLSATNPTIQLGVPDSRLTITPTDISTIFTNGTDVSRVVASAANLVLRVETPDTTGVTSSIDVNDTSVTLAISGSGGGSITFAETGLVDLSSSGRLYIASPSIELDGQVISFLADPIAAQDAATKNYVDNAINAIPDPITYQGTYNATTNTPALANTDTGVEGYLYQVTVAGTQNFGAGAISFDIGDKVVNNGTIWEKWDMTDSVVSVNGQAGIVVLDTDDVAEGASNLYYTDARVNTLVTPTVDYVNRQLKQSTFIAANWDSIGFDMRDAVNSNNGRIANISFASFAASGTNTDLIIRSNRAFTIAAAGTATISTSSSKVYNLMYSVLRASGGNESKGGMLYMAKESASSNTNASLVDTGTATNVSMNDVVFSINASGNLLITNNTAFTIDVKVGLFQL